MARGHFSAEVRLINRPAQHGERERGDRMAKSWTTKPTPPIPPPCPPRRGSDPASSATDGFTSRFHGTEFALSYPKVVIPLECLRA